MTWLTLVFFFLLVVCFLAGLILLLYALWDLRAGEQKRSFLVKGFFGVLLLVLATMLPSAVGAAGVGVDQGISDSSNSTNSTLP